MSPTRRRSRTEAGRVPLLTVVGDRARMEGKFDIADSIQASCGGEMTVGGKLVIGEKWQLSAPDVQTVDAIVMEATRAT